MLKWHFAEDFVSNVVFGMEDRRQWGRGKNKISVTQI